MKDALRRIPGIGDATIADLTARFPSQSAVNDASLSDLQDVPRITAERAIHIKAVVCEPPEPAAAVDETVPRLADRFTVADGDVEAMHEALRDRTTGRDSDVEKLLRHSLAAHQLPVAAYRGAFENHCTLIADDIPEYPGDFPIAQADGLSQEQIDDWNERERDRQMQRRRSQQMDDVGDFIAAFLVAEGPFGTKLDAIIAVKTVFDPMTPKSLPGYLIADHVGCSSGYASEFEPVQVTGQTVVLRKEYAARRQLEKAETWQRDAVLRRDGEQCVRCGAADDLVVHHITPIDAGGLDDLENMVTLCRPCHHESHGGVVSSADVVYDPDAFWGWVDSSH